MALPPQPYQPNGNAGRSDQVAHQQAPSRGLFFRGIPENWTDIAEGHFEPSQRIEITSVLGPKSDPLTLLGLSSRRSMRPPGSSPTAR